MLEYREEHIESKERKLRDFIPVVITFFVGLVVLSIYQNAMLYAIGVLDSVFNSSFLLYLLHHLGFASVISLFLAFIFNLLENEKPGLGLRVVQIVLIILLLLEAVLITYYVQNFEPLGSDFFGLFKNKEIRFSLLQASVATSITLTVCFICYKYIASFYTVISRMYPLTIVFFSIFLATLYSDKKPVNENKTQYLAHHVTKRLLQSYSYEGAEEYPLVRPFQKETGLAGYFKPMDTFPHIKIIILDGLGNEFVDGRFTDFMPNLQELKRTSLSWKNFLSNTGESHAAFPTIIGSLPFGESGFTTLPDFTYRNTLYSILRENGYKTSFNHGGNTALFNIDRFLEEEKVDQIFDRNNFGREFSLQEEDAAGITLGYPDGALFSNFHKNAKPSVGPKLDVFLTLSTKVPYHIPEIDTYTHKVANIVETSGMKASEQRFVRRNEELFASFLYADEALAQFMTREQLSPDFSSTIYVITGSHQLSELSQDNALSKYRVPLLIFSPLLKSATEIANVASHADIAPSLLALLSEKQNSKVPDQVGFLGGDLIRQSGTKDPKEVPLLRSAYRLQDYILDDLFYSDGEIYKLDKDLNLREFEDDEETRVSLLEERFQNFKTVNRYVTENNSIIPKSVSLIEDRKPKFTKEELIWIESVFNGKDFDNAYGHAKQLAFDKDYGRALLLSEYILSEIPRHADTEILMGRVRAWQGDFERSIQILSNVIRKYPKYEDGYCALMDAYFWSGKNENMYEIQRLARKNGIQDKILNEKFERSLTLIRQGKEVEGKSAIEQETVEIGSQKK
ncbi:LTA synthase family protein [Maribacter aurantiacus]|uniref:LTA synthase family protein n=1 Tax=Maribacter aurantiacus TaxID=1882343 RepID=A0A5R8M2Y4_9FLAO|nr:LTA synthase family protein [Maribacter aurantiacus]TLF43974.1 LTA synthase family protein [Maribacter aurantiacus]